MYSSRIHRYILKEIATPTILSLLIFTFVLLMGRIPRVTELVISKGIPAGEIFMLFAYLMPTFFSITVPLSFLLGILLAFGRFSADSEFIALKASGVSLYNLIKPVVLLAVFFVMLTGWMTIFVEPASKSAFRGKLFQIASSNLSINIKPGVFSDDFDGIVLYTRGVKEQLGIMQDLFISDERSGVTPAIITAQEGRFIPDPEQLRLTLRLKNGNIHRQPTDKAQSTYQTIKFASYDINIDAGTAPSNRKTYKRSEMSWGELDKAISTSTTPKQKNSLETEKHERIVIAFAPLVLVLVGVPLGLQSQRSGKGAGFAMALVVFLVYYILLSFAGTIAEKGLIPSAIILWLPNICFFTGGLYFLNRTATERPLQLFALPQKIWSAWLKRQTKTGDDQ